MCVYVCVLASFAFRYKLLQSLCLMKKKIKQMPKNQNRRGTSNTGTQMKGSATDWTIGADYEILHKPYSDLLREIHNSYHNIKHILHPERDTSTRTMKPTPQKVRKAVKKGPAKKRK